MVVTHFDLVFRKPVSVLFCFAETIFQPDVFACIDYYYYYLLNMHSVQHTETDIHTVILNVLYTSIAAVLSNQSLVYHLDRANRLFQCSDICSRHVH